MESPQNNTTGQFFLAILKISSYRWVSSRRFPVLVPMSVSSLHALSAQDQSYTAGNFMLQRFLTVDPMEDPLVVYARLAIRNGDAVTGGVPDGIEVPVE